MNNKTHEKQFFTRKKTGRICHCNSLLKRYNIHNKYIDIHFNNE